MKRMMRIKACIAASLTLCLLFAGRVMSIRAAAPDTEKAPVSENSYPVFDFESKTVKLNSGYDMPILGLGMFALSDSQAENSTYWALKAGFHKGTYRTVRDSTGKLVSSWGKGQYADIIQ